MTSERIVVGVDGSEAAAPALRWALDEARRRQATLEAVHAWHAPIVAGGVYAVAVFDEEAVAKAARELLDDVLDAEDLEGLVAPVRRTVVAEGPARGLLAVAEGADLLVVGARGIGGFQRLLLGSVSSQVVHHAPCPIVVVPDER